MLAFKPNPKGHSTGIAGEEEVSGTEQEECSAMETHQRGCDPQWRRMRPEDKDTIFDDSGITGGFKLILSQVNCKPKHM